MTDSDTWNPIKIVVKRAGLEETTYEPEGESLNCPTKCSMTLENIENPVPVKYLGPPDSASADAPSVASNEDLADLLNGYGGAALTPQ